MRACPARSAGSRSRKQTISLPVRNAVRPIIGTVGNRRGIVITRRPMVPRTSGPVLNLSRNRCFSRRPGQGIRPVRRRNPMIPLWEANAVPTAAISIPNTPSFAPVAGESCPAATGVPLHRHTLARIPLPASKHRPTRLLGAMGSTHLFICRSWIPTAG